MKIGTKIFISTGLLLIVVLLVQGAISQWIVARELKISVQQELEGAASMQGRVLTSLLKESEEDLPVLLSHKSFEDYFTAKLFEDSDGMTDAEAALEAFLVRFSKGKPQYKTIQVSTIDGQPFLQISNGNRTQEYQKFDTAAGLKLFQEKPTMNVLHQMFIDSKLGPILICASRIVVDNNSEGLLWLYQPITSMLEKHIAMADKQQLATVISRQMKPVIFSKQLQEQEAVSLVQGSLSGWLSTSVDFPRLNLTMTTAKPRKLAYAVLKKLLFSSVLTFTVAVLLSGGVLFILVRSITRPVNKISTGLGAVAKKITSASDELASASGQLSDGASSQAASLEETSASMEEITSMVRQNADNSDHGNSLMQEARKTAELAGNSMEKQINAMEDIAIASEETSKIIKTIDQIAFQTNLLALNAAVEAARAGEAGAGFAVVADEVRNLAMRSAEAATETGQLIETTVAKVENGRNLANQANNDFQQMSEVIGKSAQLMAEIASASEEQTKGIDQINKAIQDIDRITQQTAGNAEEVAHNSSGMNQMAKALDGYVDGLYQLVGTHQGIKKSDSPANNSVHHPPAKCSNKPKKRQQLLATASPVMERPVKPVPNTPAQQIPFDDDEDATFEDF